MVNYDSQVLDFSSSRIRDCLRMGWYLMMCLAIGVSGAEVHKGPTAIAVPIVVTQLPMETPAELAGARGVAMLRGDWGEGARLMVVEADGRQRRLCADFFSACDPSVSFDGQRILFAGKPHKSDSWNIFEINADGTGVRQVTRNAGNCRSPGYQSSLYTIVSREPWRQVTFVSDLGAGVNEAGQRLATSLFSCELDGASVRRLTHNLSSDFDPFLMRDGRLLFSSWQRSRLDRGDRGRIGLFGIGIDGTDFARFASDDGLRIKHMACVTDDGWVVFVETDHSPWDGAGRLSSHSLRRPLQTYAPLPGGDSGLFVSPAPLSRSRLLVSRRPEDGSGNHGVFRYSPRDGKCELVFDDPRFHDIQAVPIQNRERPDGRSSVVSQEDATGKLYCLNVNLDDLAVEDRLPPGTIQRLRVLEGIPNRGEIENEPPASPRLAGRRMLGEIDVSQDGSFNITVPATTPIELQTLDAEGMALRSCGWIWAMNHEPRGCIGCHEDGELTPENVVVDAVNRASIPLTLPPSRRRTVDFQRDIAPILEAKCVPCHNAAGALPRLDREASRGEFASAYKSLLAGGENGGSGKYVTPGVARTSPLIWHLFGRNTCRPWDGERRIRAAKPIPGDVAKPLTDAERRTFIEWIDLGAQWSCIPSEGP